MSVIKNTNFSDAVSFYVSLKGKNTWSGKLAESNSDKTDGPFATLEGARDAIREMKGRGGLSEGGVTVFIRGGRYFPKQTFMLNQQDSGTEKSRITYRNYEDEAVQFNGGSEIGDFKPVKDPNILKRLEASARGRVLQADLKAGGITDFGDFKPRGFGGATQPSALELFFQDQPMELARWPNGDWARIADVPSGKDGGRFTYSGDRPHRWKDEDEIWLHGYWTWDWAESYVKVHSIDLEKHELITESPHGVYGYSKDRRYYALNLLSELDQPGEWYLDRKSGLLYFWPPVPLDQGKIFVSILPSLISMQNVSNVTIRGLGLEVVRANALDMKGGAHNLIANCKLQNIGNIGATIEGGVDNGMRDCEIHNCGDAGVRLTGGDRLTLAPAGNFVENSHIHHFGRWVRTYQPGVYVGGVGNRIAHNLIHDAPHCGVLLNGNGHLIEFNDIHHVCMETSDTGAFYLGRDYTERGNIVRYNYFHELGQGDDVQAIYLDDWASGTIIVGNICYKAGRAILVGGGRDNLIENNVFVDCKVGIQVDGRGLSWAKNYFDGTTTTLTDRMKAVNATQPPYSVRYPQLVHLYQDEPAIPKYNRIIHNISVGGRWLDLLDGLTDKVVHLEGNWTDGDFGFVDAAKQNFQLRDDSPVFKKGFKRIPVEKIGKVAGN